MAQKYLEAFGKLAQSPNQKVLIIPMEATAVLGSLAGIGEIAKATFGGGTAGGGGSGRTVPSQPPRKPTGRRPARPASRRPAIRRRDLKRAVMMEFLVSLSKWTLADRGRRLLRARTGGARRIHAVARPLGACSSA